MPENINLQAPIILKNSFSCFFQQLKKFFKFFVYLFKFIKLIVLLGVCSLIKKTKILNLFRLMFPEFYRITKELYTLTKKPNLIFSFFIDFPIFEKIAKKMYFRFPKIVRFALKIFNLLNYGSLNLDQVLNVNKDQEPYKSEIQEFLFALKNNIAENHKK